MPLIVAALLLILMPVDSADAILLTVFLKHDQSHNLPEIQKLQEKQGFRKAFLPEGIIVVSLDVMMGIDDVVTPEVPASKLREANVALKKSAWTAFRIEFLSHLLLVSDD